MMPPPEFYGAEELHFPEHPDRPHIIFNMVSSVDGKTTTYQGSLTGLGSAHDRRVMRRIRSQVDGILVGGNTIRHDRFVPTVTEGKQPLAVVVTRSGNFTGEHPFWRGDYPRVIFVPTGISVPEWLKLQSIVREFTGDLGEVIQILFIEFAVKVLLVEGGANLNYELISQGYGDEFFLTVSPLLVGGKDNYPILGGEGWGMGDRGRQLQLVSVYPVENELYLRYRFCS